MRGDVMREFETKNYIVRATAEEDFDLDLSWDEDGETRAGLESGKYIAFCAHVEVIHKPTGASLGNDYLGGCIYKSYRDFMQPGGYFGDMISQAISEARKNYSNMSIGQLRGAR